ncbi:hypothetical protein ACHAPT_010862 [Fusarium lateritium]
MSRGTKRKRTILESPPPSPSDHNLYSQKECMLFRLPQELRLAIYSYVFSHEGLDWGRSPANKRRNTFRTIALIQTCRRARDEIGDTWIGQVQLSFMKPEVMLDTLTALPAVTLSKIRHLRLSTEPLIVRFPEFHWYLVDSILKLLPGLRLDTLVVKGATKWSDAGFYRILESLISTSGWKELHYISRRSSLLGFPGNSEVVRQPQPAHWQSIMDARDGSTSKPSVTVYRSTRCKAPGSVMNPATRVLFEQKVPDDRAERQTFGQSEDRSLNKDGEYGKEMMIVVKRGFGVDYEEKEGSPLLEGRDIRRDAPGMSWKDIRCKYDVEPVKKYRYTGRRIEESEEDD